MNTQILNTLLKSFDVFDIERALVIRFASQQNISVVKSKFLSEYLNDFKPYPSLWKEIEKLDKISLDDLSVAFELLIPHNDRIVNGAFFTPAFIVDFIIDNISPEIDEKIADISCGCGAFLLGIIRYYQSKYNKSVSSIIRNNLYGADILPYNVIRAKILLCLYGLSNGEALDADSINIFCCDSLKYQWPIQFDCIVGNPPYVKFQDLEDSTREYLSHNWTTTSFGTFNLYFAFFEAGYKLLTNKGRLGYITPNNYFTSLAGESLRTFFQDKRCVYKIIDFNATKVFDVQTYTSITFINKLRNETINYDKINNEQSPKSFLKELSFSSNPYTELNKKKWRLLCGDERFNIRQIETVGQSIGEIFDICVGIATLKDEAYSFTPHDSDKSFFYFTKNDIQWKIEKEICRSTVKISEMKTQKDITSNNRKFIFPYSSINGKMTVIPENEMEKYYPYCYAYLCSIRDTLAKRGKGKHTYTPFYCYGRTQGLNRKGIRLYTPTFSKYPRFLIDYDRNSLFTNGYGVFFRDEEQNLFAPNLISLVENLDVIQKILNSEIMNYYIRATSVAIEGGYPCYQKNFIEKFTIPDLSQEEIETIRNLKSEKDLNKYLAELYHVNLP